MKKIPSFVIKIAKRTIRRKGKKIWNQANFSIPKNLVEAYNIKSGEYYLVTLKKVKGGKK